MPRKWWQHSRLNISSQRSWEQKRLVATSGFKVGFGYRVVMPVATYFTWKGTNLEGRGLAPTIEEPFSFEASVQGRDTQLERAMRIVRETERTAGTAM